MPGAKGLVAVAHRLVEGRDGVHPRAHFLEHGNDRGKGLRTRPVGKEAGKVSEQTAKEQSSAAPKCNRRKKSNDEEKQLTGDTTQSADKGLSTTAALMAAMKRRISSCSCKGERRCRLLV